MRTIRALTTVVALVAALPSVMVAQQGRQFKDAWFWGLKAGAFTFADSSGNYTNAPVVGAEWLITRTHGGLYIAYSQAFMKTQTFFFANPDVPDTNFRIVDLKNMRKLDAILVGFPGTHIRWHPYVGAGFTLQQIAAAQGQAPYANFDEFDATERLIQDTKVGFSPVGLLGIQYRLQPVSIFAQAMLSPAQKNFLLYNGRPINLTWELGLRYNVGSSIAKEY